MFSARDLISVYLDYYKHGGVRYSLQNDVVILRAVESILQKQRETPEILLNEIEVALSQIEVALSRKNHELKQKIELVERAEKLRTEELHRKIEELHRKIEELHRKIEKLHRKIEGRRVSRLVCFTDQQMRRNPE